MNTKESILKCIEIAGGAKELASKVGVAYKTVLDWKNGRSGVSQLNCIKIEKAVEGKVKKEEILPNYPWDENHADIIREEKLEIAKKLLGMNMSKEDISTATGLSLKEIENIKS